MEWRGYHYEAPLQYNRLWVIDQPEHRGIRTHRYTFVITRSHHRDELVLHDNVEDPWQLDNIARHKPPIVNELTEELNAWLKKTNDPWQP